LIPNVLVSVSAPPKCGKNYLLYTFPDPIKVYCFNGGAEFVRAKFFPDKKIEIHNFGLPIIESTDTVWAQPVWQEFYQEYKKDAMEGKYATLGLDTSTEVENICQQAVLEDLQDAAAERNREKGKLGTTEFLSRNLRMKALFDLARNEGLNLVALNYLKEKWIKAPGEKVAQNTGELVLDGWQRTETQADINLEMARRVKGKKIVMVTTIKSNRFDRDQDGQEFADTTYDEIIALLLGE